MDDDQIIQEAAETVGEQSKRVAVAVGRMNPPTRGHYKVINAMKRFIRDHPELKLDVRPVVVVIEGKKTSDNKAKNPLTADERIKYMESSGRANGVVFLKAPSAFIAFEEVRKAGYEPIAIAAGSDRVEDYLRILNGHFKKKDGSKIEHHAVDGLDRDADGDSDVGETGFDKILDTIKDKGEVPDSMISGSLARHAAKKNDLAGFAFVVGLEKNQGLAKTLMKKIQSAMSE